MKYVILGAGPAGLTFANRLKQKGETSFVLLEKESVVGGLCRSVEVDGAPFDIGGGHFLDVRRPKVNDFLFRFMQEEEWNIFDRDSRIVLKNDVVHHPIEANIWEMSINSQVEYLKSIASAGCNTGENMPTEFVDWIFWKLGDRIANDYMIPYNQKIFGENLNRLGTYWLSKLPDVSFEDTLRSCLTRHAYGKQPGHAQFYYPKKYGYGELWLRMGEIIKNHLECNKTVESIDFANRIVVTSDGEKYCADYIITTIPWMEFRNLDGMPENIRESIKYLKYSSIQTKYYNNNLDTKAHWIYIPNPELDYHRILVRHNFCSNSKGYWTETNIERIDGKRDEGYAYINRYAYPLNMLDKPQIMDKLLLWCRSKNVYGLGRWGKHEHYNSDATVELALALADELLSY